MHGVGQWQCIKLPGKLKLEQVARLVNRILDGDAVESWQRSTRGAVQGVVVQRGQLTDKDLAEVAR